MMKHILLMCILWFLT